jgi:hypothetical protein
VYIYQFFRFPHMAWLIINVCCVIPALWIINQPTSILRPERWMTSQTNGKWYILARNRFINHCSIKQPYKITRLVSPSPSLTLFEDCGAAFARKIEMLGEIWSLRNLLEQTSFSNLGSHSSYKSRYISNLPYHTKYTYIHNIHLKDIT